MAEYIEKQAIEQKLTNGNNDMAWFGETQIDEKVLYFIQQQPTADVIERSKIDKAIEEIQSITLTMFCDEMQDLCVEIIKRNIGE